MPRAAPRFARVPWKLRWTLARAALVLLAAAAVYGIFHEHLFTQPLWTPDGRARFLGFAGVFWAVAGLLVWICPAHTGVSLVAAGLLYTAWWSGPAAPLAVFYIAGSCWLLGRRIFPRAENPAAVLAGAAVWMLLLWVALHFRVNTWWTYAAALAVPYATGGAIFRDQLRRWGTESPPQRTGRDPRPHTARELARACAAGAVRCARVPQKPRASRVAAITLALLLFVLMAHWLVALKPEVSSDGLSMHLALPMAVAQDASWPFDFRMQAWALMPAGGDCLFTAAYLLGGEAAARLLNFGFLVLIVVMLRKATGSNLVAALYASTPLVQFVTGSLFVENILAAMIFGAGLAIAQWIDSRDPWRLTVSGVLAGAALTTKLIAAAFVAPLLVIAGAVAFRRKQTAALALAVAVAAVFAAPPYLYSFAKTGNPVFPFVNTVFQSPEYDRTVSFSDSRYHRPLSVKTPYEITFKTGEFFEGQGGGAGFQFFVLLLPALFVIRRGGIAVLPAAGAAAAVAILGVLPNLRYLYPALPMLSVPIALLARDRRFMGSVLAAVTVLNVWFLPTAGWYDRGFALFRKSEIGPYIAATAPARVLIEHLNRTAPSDPVALFSTDATAGLRAPAYTGSWHSDNFWKPVREATEPEQIARIFSELRIRKMVAPRSLEADTPALRSFLARWASPTPIVAGSLGLFDVRPVPLPPPHNPNPFGAGTWDDLEERIEYRGAWLHDRQFAEAANHSITYSNTPGDSLRLTFEGAAIRYIYTKASNRGIAQVLIDGRERRRLNLFSAATEWQTSTLFDGLAPGRHVFEVRVVGGYVDLDALVVLP